MEIHSISIIIIIYFYELITQDVANTYMHNLVRNQKCISWLSDNLPTAADYNFSEFISSRLHSIVQTL